MSRQDALQERVPLRVLSLFSGIGGIDLGLERAGMEVVAHSEVDEYASQVPAKHWRPGMTDSREQRLPVHVPSSADPNRDKDVVLILPDNDGYPARSFNTNNGAHQA